MNNSPARGLTDVIKDLTPAIILMVYLGGALCVQYSRISTPNPSPWGPVLPVMTPLAWLLCALSLRHRMGLVLSLVVSAFAVCMVFVVYVILAGTWWGS